MSRSSLHDHRKGFTLTELLVALVTCLVLIAFLLSSLSTVRQQSLSVKCLNNLKNWGVAIISYGNDNNGLLPNTTSAENWVEKSSPYINVSYPYAMGSIAQYRSTPLVCPAETEFIGEPWDNYCYALNLDLVYKQYGEKSIIRRQTLRNLSTYVLLSDAYKNSVIYTKNRERLAEWTGMTRRHRGIPNFLYTDGHAAPFTRTLYGYSDPPAAEKPFYLNLWYANGIPPDER